MTKEQKLAKLHSIGVFTPEEVAYQFGLSHADAVELLYELEGGGLVAPVRWKVTDEGEAFAA